MKGFDLDENIPRNVTFAASLPVSHVRDRGASVSDTAIWDHARRNELVIVSKDADFSHRIMVSAPAPWVVHLRLGICAGGISTPCWSECGHASKRCCRSTNW